jgi:urease accessory protein
MRNTMRLARTMPLAAAALLAFGSAAFAHVGDHPPMGFFAGLDHPFTGLDHLLAMVAVGLWASQLGRRAMLLLPVLFPAAMTLGAIMGGYGVTLPWVEAGIIASVIVLGAVVALGWRVAFPASAALVGLFALFHGYAHGAEFAGGEAMRFGAGFILATIVLHLIGIGIGAVATRPLITRAAGGAIAAAGLLLIVVH